MFIELKNRIEDNESSEVELEQETKQISPSGMM